MASGKRFECGAADDSPLGINKPPALGDMPECARCRREGGITLFGRHRPPILAHIHPNHQLLRRDWKTSKVTGVERRGPSEPLCGFHAELSAWESTGCQNEYQKPMWACGER